MKNIKTKTIISIVILGYIIATLFLKFSTALPDAIYRSENKLLIIKRTEYVSFLGRWEESEHYSYILDDNEPYGLILKNKYVSKRRMTEFSDLFHIRFESFKE